MPKRTAPVRQLPSGRWQIRKRGPDGKEWGGTFDTYDGAYDALVKREADQRRGVYIDPTDTSVLFGDYAEAWVAAHPGAPRTLAAIGSSLHAHLVPAIGHVPLGALRTTQLQAVISRLAVAPGTKALVLRHLRQVLNGAVEDRMIGVNPAKNVRLPRAERAELVIPTPEEVAAIVDGIEERSRALVVVGAGLGLRQGECFGLSLDRVDFLRRRVVVDRQLQVLTAGVLVAPKTPRSVRTVPMSEAVALELARQVKRFPSDDPDGLLFTTRLGTRIRHSRWNSQAWKPPSLRRGGRS
jgi:integrase